MRNCESQSMQDRILLSRIFSFTTNTAHPDRILLTSLSAHGSHPPFVAKSLEVGATLQCSWHMLTGQTHYRNEIGVMPSGCIETTNLVNKSLLRTDTSVTPSFTFQNKSLKKFQLSTMLSEERALILLGPPMAGKTTLIDAARALVESKEVCYMFSFFKSVIGTEINSLT